jgi:protein ImuA
MLQAPTLSCQDHRAVVIGELRRLLPRSAGFHKSLPLGLAALDSCLPEGGLTCGALHEIVPETDSATAAAFGFIAAVLGRLMKPRLLVCVTPAYGHCPHYGHRPHGRLYGRLHGHGLNALGLNPSRLILVETAHRKETLWAIEEALHSSAPAAVIGSIDKLDLRTSQRLQLAANDTGLPLFLLRPSPTLESSAAATRWRVGTAKAARDRFGLVVRPRWHLHLERCRNGRPGQWVVEYDHVAHCFSLPAAVADSSHARGASEAPLRTAHCA